MKKLIIFMLLLSAVAFGQRKIDMRDSLNFTDTGELMLDGEVVTLSTQTPDDYVDGTQFSSSTELRAAKALSGYNYGGQTIYADISDLGSLAVADGAAYYASVFAEKSGTCIGIEYFNRDATVGDFVGELLNGFSAYLMSDISNGVLKGQTISDENYFKIAANTSDTAKFTSSFEVIAGEMYKIGVVCNWTGTPTQPASLARDAYQTTIIKVGGVSAFHQVFGTTSWPSTVSFTSATNTTLGLYVRLIFSEE